MLKKAFTTDATAYAVLLTALKTPARQITANIALIDDSFKDYINRYPTTSE